MNVLKPTRVIDFQSFWEPGRFRPHSCAHTIVLYKSVLGLSDAECVLWTFLDSWQNWTGEPVCLAQHKICSDLGWTVVAAGGHYKKLHTARDRLQATGLLQFSLISKGPNRTWTQYDVRPAYIRLGYSTTLSNPPTPLPSEVVPALKQITPMPTGSEYFGTPMPTHPDAPDRVEHNPQNVSWRLAVERLGESDVQRIFRLHPPGEPFTFDELQTHLDHIQYQDLTLAALSGKN